MKAIKEIEKLKVLEDWPYTRPR